MKILERDVTYNTHSRFNEPGICVDPGEIFIAKTELNSGPWLKSAKSAYGGNKGTGGNRVVVAKINGVEAGDTIAVKIIAIKPDDLGYTGFNSIESRLSQQIWPENNWGRNIKIVKIEDGHIIWDDFLKIPVKPMIGVLGTAPEKEILLNACGGRHGGNMDVNEVRAGSTVYLNTFTDGALLHIGDVHAIQGDGEINHAGGIECRAEITLKVDILRKKKNNNWIRIEDDDHIMTVACLGSVEDSFYAAANELITWMTEDFGFLPIEAYYLMGQVMEARCTQFVNPTRSYICKMPKKYLLKKLGIRM